MRLYMLSVRRWWAVVPSLGLLVSFATSLGELGVPVPSLLTGFTTAPAKYFSPVLVVGATMYVLDRRLADAEATAVTRVRRLDLGGLIVTVLAAHAAGSAAGWEVSRNTMLLLGLALVVRRYANEAAATASALGFLILAILAGRGTGPDGHAVHAWWAIPLYPSVSLSAWLVAAAVFAIGCATATRPRDTQG
ncbi:hypothetical protein ACF1G0_11375 [Streptomyces sp. NPDC013953]|uniref:hypothetical protein n=1 Tax=Streptomyces sp. NPDC013953 TaxID=3364868 RepID=UPI0036F68646